MADCSNAAWAQALVEAQSREQIVNEVVRFLGLGFNQELEQDPDRRWKSMML